MNHSMTSKALIAVLVLIAGAGCKNQAQAEARAEVSAPLPQGPVLASDGGGSQRQFTFSGRDSRIDFVGAKVTLEHDGGFKDFEGKVVLAEGGIEGGKIELSIEMDSLWSDSEQLTGHLKTADFFDVAKYPQASFVSTSIVASGEPGSTHVVTGNLSLHGVEKSVSFPATIELTSAGFSARGEFNMDRKQFGIVYPGMPDDLIRDDVLVKLAVKGSVSGS